jgi:hypothetical protein
VEVERFNGEPPQVRVFEEMKFVPDRGLTESGSL